MNKIISFTLPFILLFMVGCSQEEKLSVDNGENGKKLVPVNIVLPSSTNHTQTRSDDKETGSDQENQITALYITLKFGSEVVERTIVGDELTALLGQVNTDGNPSIKVICDVDYMIWNNAETIDATVFANYQTAPSAITNEADFWNGEKIKPLFMSGHTPDMPKEKGNVDLLRQVAKLRTKIGKTADCIPANLQILYDEIKVQVLHVADRSAALSGGSIEGLQYIDYAMREARNNITKGDYQPDVMADSCYIHENTNYVASDPTTITTLKIQIPTFDPLTNHREVLEKEYQIKGKSSTDFKIERNHIYTLDIKIRSQKEPLDIFLNVESWGIQDINDPNLEPVPTTN